MTDETQADAIASELTTPHVQGSDDNTPEAPIGDGPTLEVLRDALAASEARVAELETELAASRKAAEKAEKAAKAVASRAPVKPRKIGPLADKDIVTASDLLDLIRSADDVEIGFSNGKTEIAGLLPVRVTGDGWSLRFERLVLSLPALVVAGPAPGQVGHRLAGYGLFIDGDLVAYGARGEVMTIAPGQQYDLKDDIVF